MTMGQIPSMAAAAPAINPWLTHAWTGGNGGPNCGRAPMRLQTPAMAAPPAKQSDIELPDLGATAALARKLAELAWPGAVIGLSGPLGSGKTTFARAFIEAAAERFRVPPSPLDRRPSI